MCPLPKFLVTSLRLLLFLFFIYFFINMKCAFSQTTIFFSHARKHLFSLNFDQPVCVMDRPGRLNFFATNFVGFSFSHAPRKARSRFCASQCLTFSFIPFL